MESGADVDNSESRQDAVVYGECAELRYTEPITSPLDLLRGDKVVRICAPMVRYSK